MLPSHRRGWVKLITTACIVFTCCNQTLFCSAVILKGLKKKSLHMSAVCVAVVCRLGESHSSNIIFMHSFKFFAGLYTKYWKISSSYTLIILSTSKWSFYNLLLSVSYNVLLMPDIKRTVWSHSYRNLVFTFHLSTFYLSIFILINLWLLCRPQKTTNKGRVSDSRF